MAKFVKRVIITDVETGEIIKDSVNYGTQNGDDWVIWYREALESLAMDAPLVALKVLCFFSQVIDSHNLIFSLRFFPHVVTYGFNKNCVCPLTLRSLT